ncbi:Hypothetical protein NTJ_08169 [Nesidiocoris tenuis]|uniref:Uncharacterized protein n=1 Tax=Nesidiocoris tenuis TaxID=355587 RepID=A0ABN7AV05_9HEMI|nr:Hypothetical protein NTJ_08169 [Nesidiocoris tenuis]
MVSRYKNRIVAIQLQNDPIRSHLMETRGFQIRQETIVNVAQDPIAGSMSRCHTEIGGPKEKNRDKTRRKRRTVVPSILLARPAPSPLSFYHLIPRRSSLTTRQFSPALRVFHRSQRWTFSVMALPSYPNGPHSLQSISDLLKIITTESFARFLRSLTPRPTGIVSQN